MRYVIYNEKYGSDVLLQSIRDWKRQTQKTKITKHIELKHSLTKVLVEDTTINAEVRF